MTKRVQITDLREVKILRVICTKCGTAITSSLKHCGSAELCRACNKRVNMENFLDLASAIGRLNASKGPAFRVEIETEDSQE